MRPCAAHLKCMHLIRLLPIFAIAGFVSAGPIYSVTDLGSLGGSSANAFDCFEQGGGGRRFNPFDLNKISIFFRFGHVGPHRRDRCVGRLGPLG